MSSDRFYFRQLLSGRDFAANDPVAQQMVNFVYAVGDRATSECVLIDPAYAVNELLDIVEADGMKVIGVLATHFHPDHIGGSLGGHTVEGVATLLERWYNNSPTSPAADQLLWPYTMDTGIPQVRVDLCTACIACLRHCAVRHCTA